MKKSTSGLMWVLLAVVVVAGILVMTKSGNKGSIFAPSQNSPTPTPTASQTGSANKTTTPKSGLTYSQALQQYASSRIQFNSQCQAISSATSIKKGTKIMLDNRSGSAITVGFGEQTFNISKDGWLLATAPTNKPLPYDLGISCKSPTAQTVNSLVLKIQANILQGL